MDGQACPLPGKLTTDEAQAIEHMLAARRVAVVGLSDDPSRPSYGVAAYLQEQGFEILPVNPSVQEVLGRKSYAALSQIPGPVDVVVVFRRPEHVPEIARQAAQIGAKGLWLQSGITSAQARQTAAQAGMDYVEDRCMKVEHRRRLRG